MPTLEPEIRSAARALIVREGHILMLRKEYETGEIRYALPGGAQEKDESLTEALQRECEEEIGTTIRAGDLAYVAEHFRPRSASPDSHRHLLETLFWCSVDADYEPKNGPKPDKHQVAVEWLDFGRLSESSLSHPFLSESVARGAIQTHYLGVF